MRCLHRVVGLVFLLILLAPAAASQVVVEQDATTAKVHPGESAAFAITLTNPTDREFYFVAVLSGDLTDSSKVVPDRSGLGPRSDLKLNVSINVPRGEAPGIYRAVVQLTLIDRGNGEAFDREVTLIIDVGRTSEFLGFIQQSFPAPFNAGWGLFAIEFVVWIGAAFLIAVVGNRVVHSIGLRAPESIREKMATKIRAPIGLLIVVLGLNFSLRLLPASPLVAFAQKLTSVAAVLAAAVVAFRAIGAGLLYFSALKSRDGDVRTNRVVVPVLEKLAAVGVTVLAILYGLRALGTDVSFLLTGGVVIGLILSLAAQDTLSNLFSGLFILIDRPFQEGDEIRLETGDVCRVDRIGLRSTRLFHFRHEQVMIAPNNELATRRVVNMSYPDSTYRMLMEFDVAYSTNLREAVEHIMDAARSTPNVMQGPGREPVIWLREFSPSGITMQLRVYIPSSRHRNPVRTALMYAIKDKLDKHGIVIPIPQHEVWLRRGTGPGPYGGDDDASPSALQDEDD